MSYPADQVPQAEQLSFYALTARGLSETLQKELISHGFKTAGVYQGGVLFKSDWKGCYYANLWLRTASRIVKPIAEFDVTDGEDLYEQVRKHDFTQYIDVTQTLFVEASVANTPGLTDQRFVAMKTKDAIVDQFRDKFGERPSVDRDTAGLRIWIRIQSNKVMMGIDTTGEPLFKRHYRVESVPAPVKEHVAAGLLQLTGWDQQTPLLDPMCGSGTFLVEAAMLASRMAPGILKTDFAFQKYKNYDEAAWDEIVQAAQEQELEELTVPLFGFDADREAMQAARANAKAAGFAKNIQIHRSSVDISELPEEMAGIKGTIIVNPPYGERLEKDEPLLQDVYKDLGFALKTRYKGWRVWVLSPRRDLTDLMAMKPFKRYKVWNGPIECEFSGFDVF
ncbi:MAG: class I SAM-dependent RNA methyltransferase [Bdellovibrionales bacterium]